MSTRDLRSAPLLARGCGTRTYEGSSPTNIRRGVIRTTPPVEFQLGEISAHGNGRPKTYRIQPRTPVRLELPADAYKGVACWYSDIDWLIQADLAYQMFYRLVRHALCDHNGVGGVGRKNFRKVCAARASAADWDTGRNSRLAVETIMAITDLSERTVQRATQLMKILGIATEVFRGRQRTYRERMASWRMKDKGRGWASVYALHPPNNPQVAVHKFRIDPLPQKKVAPHPLGASLGEGVSFTSNSLKPTGDAGDPKSRASRDSARTKRGQSRRSWPPPDPKGLVLARKWRQHARSPRWAQRHSLEAWARVLAPVAAHDWTPEDLHQLVREHPGLPWIATDPRKPLALMGALIKNHAAADDLSYRPAYHDMLRDQEFHDAAEQRRQAIAQCADCGDDGYLLGPDRTAVEPLVRCAHTACGI
ncbi:helix-turn-helix domain-containing protein [Gordonia sputi]